MLREGPVRLSASLPQLCSAFCRHHVVLPIIKCNGFHTGCLCWHLLRRRRSRRTPAQADARLAASKILPFVLQLLLLMQVSSNLLSEFESTFKVFNMALENPEKFSAREKFLNEVARKRIVYSIVQLSLAERRNFK